MNQVMKFKTPVLLIVLLFHLGNIAVAQQKIHQKITQNASQLAIAKTVNPFSKVVTDNLNHLINDRDLTSKIVLSLTKTDLASLKTNTNGFLKVAMPLNSQVAELQLFETNIFSGDYQVVQSNGTQRNKVEVDSGVHYWGIVKDEPNSLVALSVFENEVTGMVMLAGETYNLGKIKQSNYHILYRASDLNLQSNFTCDAIDPIENSIHKQIEQQTENQKNQPPTECVNIHIEADYDFYLDMGSSVASTTNYINALMAQVAILYANESITIMVSFINVWTNTSPYDAASGDLSVMLDELRLYGWGQSNGNLVHLITTIGGGGIAYLDVLCNSQFNVGVSNIFTNFNNVPTYSWDVEVIAHELGHNHGSPHTHSCSWNGNNTAIDDCGYNFSGGTDGCDGPTPAAGTIMSYCHLINGVGIDFNLGFGQQPGNLIRSRVNAANCLTPCAEPTCDDTILNGDEVGVDCGGPDCPPCPDEVCDDLNFNDYNLISYADQDNGTATISAGGTEIFITGNSWKAIAYNLTVSPITTISFEFRSTQQGEIHEIAFDNDLNLDRDHSLVVWGNQGFAGTLSNATYNGSGNWQTFTINIGAQISGSYTYLIFTCDDDANATGNSYFKNIKIWEDYDSNLQCDGVASCAAVDLDIFFDGFPSQTSWDITDANGSTVASSNGTYGSQTGNSSITEQPACLPDGCYTFTMYDALNNGMCPFQSSAVGVSTFITPGTLISPGSIVGTLSLVATPGLCGNYELTNAAGEVLASGGGSFGAQEASSFCLSGGMLQRKARTEFDTKFTDVDLFRVFPTITAHTVQLSFQTEESSSAVIQIFDLNGKLMNEINLKTVRGNNQVLLDISNYQQGTYVVKLQLDNEQQYHQKIIKQ